MSTQISDACISPAARARGGALTALVLLSGCQPALPDKPAAAKREVADAAYAKAEGRIACAPPGAERFTASCTVDRVESQDGLFLTLRQPEGGLHRLLVTTDGRGVAAADGA